jgi:hypothetical protein
MFGEALDLLNTAEPKFPIKKKGKKKWHKKLEKIH